MEAAYRFFDNDKVSPENILQPHFDATRERISQNDFALLVQDTSEINLTRPHQQVQGAGPMVLLSLVLLSLPPFWRYG
jgi:hypothetical protein